MVTITSGLSLLTSIGCSILIGVKLTSSSNISLILSVGFSVQHSVHVVARWLRTDLSEKTSLDRVRSTMSSLVVPT